MARLEALIEQAVDAPELRLALEQLAAGLAGTLHWLDERDATLALSLAQGQLPVQVLLELRRQNELAILLKSSEPMGSGAPLSRAVLDALLQAVLKAVEGSRLVFRSDLDGPTRQAPRPVDAAADRNVLAAAP